MKLALPELTDVVYSPWPLCSTFEVYERSGSGGGTSSTTHSPSPSVFHGAEAGPGVRPERSLLISVSEGAHSSNVLDLSLDARHALTVLPRNPLTQHMDLESALGKLGRHFERSLAQDLSRGQVEGDEVFFGVEDKDLMLMPVKQRRESMETDAGSVVQA